MDARSVLALSVLLLPMRALGSAQELFGAAPRDLALAGAATALGDHPGAIVYDPAGLTDAPRLRLHTSAMAADLHLTIDGKPAPGVLPLQSTSVGFTLPIPLQGALADRIAAGFLFETPDGRLIRVYSLPADRPQFVLLQNHAQVLGAFVGAGVAITRSVSAGFGIRVLANARASVAVEGSTHRVANDTDGFLRTTLHPFASLRLAPPGAHWRAALSWRRHSQQTFAVPTHANLGGLYAPEPALFATTGFEPTEVIAGGAWSAGAFGVTLDLPFKRWSEFPDPTVGVGRISPAAAPFPKFHDTVAPRSGVEWTHAARLDARPFSFTLRGGLGYEPSPVPSQPDDYSLFDGDRTIAGLGTGVAMPWRAGRIAVDLGLQAQFVASRHWSKNPASVPAGTPLEHSTSGRLLAGALGVSWEY